MKPHSVLGLCLAVACAFAAQHGHAQATLSAPAEAGINETIEVQVSGTPASGDMLRFADPEGTVLGGSYAYVGNARDGVLSLTAPLEPGAYQVVYLSNREIVAASPLTVHAVEARLEVPERVGINEHFTVAFEGPDNHGDWIQVTQLDGSKVGGSYAYTSLAKDGKLSLKAPVQPGRYRVTYETGRRVIGQAEFEVYGLQASLVVPESVPAGAHFEVPWEGPDNAGDIIRVLDASSAATGSYAYVGNNPGAVSLRAPEQVDDFRVVYLTAGEVIGSGDFRVTDVSASLDAPETAPGSAWFIVQWEGPGNHGDVIELVPAGAEDDVAYAYIQSELDRQVQISAPDTPGPYKLHYVTHGGRTLATRAIEITPPVQKPGTLQVLAHAQPRLSQEDAVAVVLDASGSMLQRQGGERRIDIAKRTLQHLIEETIPEGTLLAMRVFGHKEADSCRSDLEIPLGPLDRTAATGTLAGITAMNLARTPIADSLSLTDSDLRGVSGERIIVLVTDGEETCEGDPAAVIAAIRAQCQDVRFNIVGYAIDDAELQDSFERWAALGGGAYFDAADEAQLAEALAHSVAPSFAVLDESGREITTGVAGGAVVSLSPGSYIVQVSGQDHPVAIKPESRTTLDLNLTVQDQP